MLHSRSKFRRTIKRNRNFAPFHQCAISVKAGCVKLNSSSNGRAAKPGSICCLSLDHRMCLCV